MAYTQADLDQLRVALIAAATGAAKVRFADGRETTFQDPEKVAATIKVVEAQLQMQARAASGVSRRRTPYVRTGL